MKLAFFYCRNAAGNSTYLNVFEVASIVYREDQDKVIVGMNNGEEYGFNGPEIRRQYDLVIGRDKQGIPITDPALKTLVLLRYEAEHTPNLKEDS